MNGSVRKTQRVDTDDFKLEGPGNYSCEAERTKVKREFKVRSRVQYSYLQDFLTRLDLFASETEGVGLNLCRVSEKMLHITKKA